LPFLYKTYHPVKNKVIIAAMNSKVRIISKVLKILELLKNNTDGIKIPEGIYTIE
jgi:hypothetical protein